MRQPAVSEQVVIDRASELGQVLGASRSFHDYEHALEQYQSDASAADLLEPVRRLEQEASMREMVWGDSDGAWAEKLKTAQERVRAHPVIRTLRQAEAALMALLFGAVLRLGELSGIDYAEACTGRSLSGCGPARSTEEFAAALRNSPEVATAIETLGGSIRETEAYYRFDAAQRRFQHDPEVVRIREQVKAVVEAYIRAQQNGTATLEIIQEVREVREVRKAQNSLREHPVVQDFSGKRQEVHTLFQMVNRTIGEVLGLDVAQAVAPASGCCG